jgi:hypothetical protein
VGTPISAGAGTLEDPGDLYSVLLRREETQVKNGEPPRLLYAVCPAWTVKEGCSKKAWDVSLTEDEVELLFPSRLTFKYLMGKLRECLATDPSAKIFRQQSLVSWVPDDESAVTVTFTETALRSRLRPRAYYDATALPGAPVYFAWDDATSISRYADYSAGAILRVQPVTVSEGTNGSSSARRENALVVLDVIFGRWKLSERIINICKAFEQHHVTAWVLEKDRGYEELVLGVRKMCHLKGLPMPHVILRDIKSNLRAKATKVKILEAPLDDFRLWFVAAPWNDACFQQFVRFDGIKKSGSSDGSKDDIPDAVATGYQVWGPRAAAEVDPEEASLRRREEDEEDRRLAKEHFYNRMHGGIPGTRFNSAPPTTHAQKVSQWLKGITPEPEAETPKESEKPRDPRLIVFGGKGPWRM